MDGSKTADMLRAARMVEREIESVCKKKTESILRILRACDTFTCALRRQWKMSCELLQNGSIEGSKLITSDLKNRNHFGNFRSISNGIRERTNPGRNCSAPKIAKRLSPVVNAL